MRFLGTPSISSSTPDEFYLKPESSCEFNSKSNSKVGRNLEVLDGGGEKKRGMFRNNSSSSKNDGSVN